MTLTLTLTLTSPHFILDEILKETLARVEAQEERVLTRVESQVKEMVKEQLKAAGFDSQLSVGDLPSVQAQGTTTTVTTYAEAASRNKSGRREERVKEGGRINSGNAGGP